MWEPFVVFFFCGWNYSSDVVFLFIKTLWFCNGSLWGLMMERYIHVKPFWIIDLRKRLYLDDSLDISERVHRCARHPYENLDLTKLFYLFAIYEISSIHLQTLPKSCNPHVIKSVSLLFVSVWLVFSLNFISALLSLLHVSRDYLCVTVWSPELLKASLSHL